MEIVVKIPDDMIKSLEQGNFGAKYNIYNLGGCLMNGTPLPEHHGRLIDADRINLHNISPCDDEMLSVYGATVEDIEEAPTIIERSDNE